MQSGFSHKTLYGLLSCCVILLLIFNYICLYWVSSYTIDNNYNDRHFVRKRSIATYPTQEHLSTWRLSHSASHVTKNSNTSSPLWYNITSNTILWHVAHYEHRYFAYNTPSAILLMFFHYYMSPLPTLYVKVYTTTSNGDIWERGCIQSEWLNFGKIVQVDFEVDFLYFAVYKLGDNSFIPDYIDLYFEDYTCAVSSPIIKVLPVYYKHNEKQIDFATCLYKGLEANASVFDSLDIASWIELNRALGIKHITMYNQNLTTKMLQTLNKYQQEGFVDIVDWKIHNPDLRIANNGQVATIQDCFYRYLRRAKYIMFVDLDELIVPHNHSTIPQMIDYLNKQEHNVTQYRFYNSFWHNVGKPVYGTGKLSTPELKLPVHFRHTNRTFDCPPTIRHKNIIKVETAVRIGIHNVYKMKGGERMYQVPEEIGLMHHYRTPDYAYGEKQIEDMIMSKYAYHVMRKLKDKNLIEYYNDK